MAADTLVLNRFFSPFQTMSKWNAVSLLYQGHAEAVDENYMTHDFESWADLSQAMTHFPNGFIQTTSIKLAVPDVIRIIAYDKVPREIVKFTRRNVYDHYKYTCCYCGNAFGSSNLNMDHVLPRSRGGGTGWLNIVLSCVPCNTRKANKTPVEAGMKLRVTPTQPKPRGVQSYLSIPVGKRESWQRFIDRKYWDSELESD